MIASSGALEGEVVLRLGKGTRGVLRLWDEVFTTGIWDLKARLERGELALASHGGESTPPIRKRKNLI